MKKWVQEKVIYRYNLQLIHIHDEKYRKQEVEYSRAVRTCHSVEFPQAKMPELTMNSNADRKRNKGYDVIDLPCFSTVLLDRNLF